MGRFIVLALCLLFSSSAIPAPYLPSSFVHQAYFLEADGILAEFDGKISDNEFEEAARIIQTGIEKSGSTVTKSDTFEYGSTRAMFTSKILSSGAPLISAYRLLYDTKAEELYNKALLAKDKNILKDVLDIYGATSFAEKSGLALADFYLAEGAFRSALQYLNNVKSPDAGVLFKQALCLEELEDREGAQKIYTEIAIKYASFELVSSGKTRKAGDLAAEFSLLLASKPSEFVKLPFQSGSLALKWEGQKIPENKLEISEPVVAGNSMCMVVDKAFKAYELGWGAEIFSYDYSKYREGALFPVLCGAGVSGEGNMVAAKFFANRVGFALFDLDKKETILYASGEQIASEKGRFNGALNLPLIKDNALYLGLTSKKDNLSSYYLTKLGKSKGEIIWSLFLGSGVQTQFMFENAPAPVIAGDAIVVETNLFTVACVDRERGTLEWSYGCPPENEVPADDRLFVHEPPYRNLAADGSMVFYFPKQSKIILGINMADGRNKWSLTRGQMEYLVGESGGDLFTADTARIYRLDKLTGKRSEVFNLTLNKCLGRVTFFDGFFYFPASGKDGSAAINVVDKKGQKFTSYPVLDKVFKLFPVKGGIAAFGEERVRFYQDSILCAEDVRTAAGPAALYAGALLKYARGNTEEAVLELKKLGGSLKDGDMKDTVGRRLEQIALSRAGELVYTGDIKGAINLLEGLESRSVEGAWLLSSCYEKLGETVKAAENFKNITESYKGKSFKPEAGLSISADYLARVKQGKKKEYFPSEPLWQDKNFDVTVKPLWKTTLKGYAPTLMPYFTGELLIHVFESGVNAIELESGKTVGESVKLKKRIADISYGAYGFYPLASSGDSKVAYFCTPDFNVFGVEAAKLTTVFEWKPETTRTPAFAPYCLGSTESLLIIYDPSEGFMAIEKKDGSIAYRIKGEFARPCYYQDAIFAVNKRNMILYRFETVTGSKKWEHNLQAGSQNLEIKCDGNVLYIITEEGVIYKVKPDSGYRLMAKNISPEKGGFDLFPSAMSASTIYLSTGRSIISLDKSSLVKNWIKDTYTTFRIEIVKGSKKRETELGKVLLVEKPAELQKDISWLYVAGDKLLAFSGEYLEVYDAATGKAELWGDKALRILPADKLLPAYAFVYNNKLILGKGPVLTAFPIKR